LRLAIGFFLGGQVQFHRIFVDRLGIGRRLDLPHHRAEAPNAGFTASEVLKLSIPGRMSLWKRARAFISTATVGWDGLDNDVTFAYSRFYRPLQGVWLLLG